MLRALLWICVIAVVIATAMLYVKERRRSDQGLIQLEITDPNDPQAAPRVVKVDQWITVESAGLDVDVDGIGSLSVPSAVLDSPAQIRLYTQARPELAAIFEDRKLIYRAVDLLEYFLLIETKPIAPQAGTVRLKLDIPDDFGAKLGPGQSLRAFAYFNDVSEAENFEIFEPVSRAGREGVLTFELPGSFFSQGGTNGSVFEAVIAVAIIDAPPAAADRDPALVGCSSTLSPPFDAVTPQVYESLFGDREHPITGLVTPHYGVDYRLDEGTPLRAMADGEIVHIGYQVRGATGWGHWLMVQHDDGSAALYAHLDCSQDFNREDGSIDACRDYKYGRVKRGDVIAKSGQSGGVTGPHLHLEVVNAYEGGWGDSIKLNPFDCVSECNEILNCGGKLVCDSGVAADGFGRARPRRCRQVCQVDEQCASKVCISDEAQCARLDDVRGDDAGIPVVGCPTCWKPVSFYVCGSDEQSRVCPEGEGAPSACGWWAPSQDSAPPVFGHLPRCL